MEQLQGKTAIVTGAAGGIEMVIIGRENIPAFYESLRSLHPLGRNTRPDDVAVAALFLACDQSEFITGVLLNVDGGRHLATNRPPVA